MDQDCVKQAAVSLGIDFKKLCGDSSAQGGGDADDASSSSPCKTLTNGPVKWKPTSCTKVSADGVSVPAPCSNGWNGGAVSTIGVTGPASVYFRCPTNDKSMIGFFQQVHSNHSAYHSYKDIACGMYCDHGTLRVYEQGHHVYNGPRYSPAQTLRIVRGVD